MPRLCTDAARNSAAPARYSRIGKIRWRSMRFCRAETMSTPPTAPKTSALVKRPNPAAPASSTSLANTAPNGMSIPPPMRAMPRLTFTARTVGLMNTYDQPSFSSWRVWARSIFVLALRSVSDFGWRARSGIASRYTM